MPQSIADPGAALRKLREDMGWTLAEVGRKTGLTVSTLSKIENNRVSLNFDKLSRLSAGLGIDMARLLDPRAAANNLASASRRSITRADAGRTIETANYRHAYHATDLLQKKFIPIIAEVRARTLAEFGELTRHPGEEFALALEGVIEVHTDHYAPVKLYPGDSIYIDSRMGHAYIAASNGPCRLLSISSDLGQQEHVEDSHAPPARGAKTVVLKDKVKTSAHPGTAKRSARRRARK